MRISDWSSDVCSSDLEAGRGRAGDCGEAIRVVAGATVEEGRDRIRNRRPGRWRGEGARRGGRGMRCRQRLVVQRPAVSVALFDGNAGTRHFDFRSEEHTSELQSLMRISYAVFVLK